MSTNDWGRQLADKSSAQHQALTKFSMYLDKKQDRVWRFLYMRKYKDKRPK